jgi:hypothetical protein
METAPCAEKATKRSLPLEQIAFKELHKYTHTRTLRTHTHITSFQAQFGPADSPYVYSQMLEGAKRFNRTDDRSIV